MFHASHHITPVPATEDEIEVEASAVRAVADDLCPLKIVLDRVVLTSTGVLLGCWQYFVEAGAIAVRRVHKEDMRHVAKATGATMVLAVNAAKDATDLVAKLRAYHTIAQTQADKKHLSSMGLELLKGTVCNNLEAGVIEPAMSKVKIIQFATEAAITILRIDDMIRLVKDEGQGDQD